MPTTAIRFELFTTDADRIEGDIGRPVVVRPDEETIRIDFTLDGLSSTVESPVSANESILNAALRVRSDVPFACAGGVCGTCRARLIEGKVQMTENYALEPDELERGYVLTCQSHPKTPTVDGRLRRVVASRTAMITSPSPTASPRSCSTPPTG